MNIKSSTTLTKNYDAISMLAHETGEPVYITRDGKGDTVLMSMETFEEREQMLREGAAILEAEGRRLQGEPAYTTDEVRAMLRERRYNDVA